ncbi:FRG domain-containing protein [Flammeovirga sp. OC4]|uniref:FRG domain-containing protein n=1 Tax=Flammeovirga sp. OC4 TaxID=1382345 RepID=UPI000694DE3B|nr:FRG domain-containing protein [Flammeovirga sp. OC4]
MTKVDPSKHWLSFLEWINNLSSLNIYRGVSDREFLLVPSVGRHDNYTLNNEIDLFENFKLKANMFTKGSDDFEWLALAQHHGLPTRLLDWTYNPLIATYFSVRENKEKDARIYSLQPNHENFINPKMENSPFSIQNIKFINPPVSTRRIELQKGLFSIHPLPQKPVIIYKNHLIEMEYAHHDSNRAILTKNVFKPLTNKKELFQYQEDFYESNRSDNHFNIPSYCKNSFEENIRKLGIDEMIFGDIDSIAELLKYQLDKKIIKNTSSTKFNYAHPIISRKIESHIIDFFKNNPTKLIFHNNKQVINSSINVNIKESIESSYNIKYIKGSMFFRLIPNLKKSDTIFLNFNKVSQRNRIITKISKEVFNENNISEGLLYINFSCKVLFSGSYENLNISDYNLELDSHTKEYLDNLNISYDKAIKQYQSIISKVNEKYLENIDLDSQEFTELIGSLKEQF